MVVVSPTVVLIGLESVGKTALFRNLKRCGGIPKSGLQPVHPPCLRLHDRICFSVQRELGARVALRVAARQAITSLVSALILATALRLVSDW